MAKKINYFDDDYDNQNSSVDFNLITVDRAKRKQSVARNSKAENKPVDSKNAVVLSKISTKNAKKIIKSIAQKSDPNKMTAKQRWLLLLAFIIILAIIIVVTVFSTLHIVTDEAKRQSEFNDAAGIVCMDYEETYGPAGFDNLHNKGILGCRMTGLCYVRDLDFNNDNRSELLLCYRQGTKYNYEVWGYSGDQFVMLHQAPIHQTEKESDHAWFTIYTKNGHNYLCEHDPENVKKAEILELKGTKFVHKDTVSFDTSDGIYSVKGKKQPDSFERIKMAVINSHEASTLSEKIQDKVDKYIGKTKPNTGHAQKVNMMNAYYAIVMDYNNKYGEAEFVDGKTVDYIDGLAYVSLIDFNNDDVDELILAYRRPINTKMLNDRGEYVATTIDRYFCDVYAWNGTNAWRVFQQEGLGSMLNDKAQKYILLKHASGKTMLCFNTFTKENYDRVIEGSSKILKFNGQTFKATTKAWYRDEYGYKEFRYNGKYVNQYTFEHDGGYQVPFFDGKEILTDSDYTVIYLQTDKDNDQRINNIVSNTVDTIKKLNKGYEPENKD